MIIIIKIKFQHCAFTICSGTTPNIATQSKHYEPLVNEVHLLTSFINTSAVANTLPIPIHLEYKFWLISDNQCLSSCMPKIIIKMIWSVWEEYYSTLPGINRATASPQWVPITLHSFSGLFQPASVSEVFAGISATMLT